MYLTIELINTLEKAGLGYIVDELASNEHETMDILGKSGRFLTYFDKKRGMKRNPERTMHLLDHEYAREEYDIYHDCRTKIKPIKGLNMVLGRKVTQDEEDKILAEFGCDNYYFEIVEGDDIKAAYYEGNYAPDCGSLNKSCMRNAFCQSFFQFYIDNCKLLVLRHKNDDKVHGRAILWHNVRLSEQGVETIVNFMDRAYCCSSKAELFVEYARKHGYAHKTKQTMGCPTIRLADKRILDITKQESWLYFCVSKEYDQYPYFDTLCWADPDFPRTFSTIQGLDYVEFQRTDGDKPSRYYCEDCGEPVEEDDVHYTADGASLCAHCFNDGGYVYCEDRDSAVQRDETYKCSVCENHYYHDHSVVYIEGLDEFRCLDCLRHNSQDLTTVTLRGVVHYFADESEAIEFIERNSDHFEEE